jgi:hypothetical protein
MMSLGLMLVIVLVIIGVILIILLVLFCSDEFDAGRSGAHRSHADCELSNFVQLSPWHRISIAEYGFYAWPRGSEFLAFGPDRFACGASVS